MKSMPSCRHITGWLLIFCLNSSGQMLLNLDQALDAAMENSPNIRQYRLNLERSEQSLKAQHAALKSQFSLSLTPLRYDRSREFNTFFNTWNTSETKSSSGMFRIAQPLEWTDGTLSLINSFGWQDSYSEFRDQRDKSFSNNLYLSWSQPIFTYNRTRLALRELELELEDQRLIYATQKLSLERSVTQSFYNAYYQKLNHQIAQEEAQNQQESYEIIRNKVEAGLSAQEELYQAELNLSSAQSKVQNASVQLENSRDELKKLLGVSLFDSVDVIADVSHHAYDVDLNKALETGLTSRMELRQREIDIDNARAQLIRAAAQNEFKGNVEVVYGIIGTDEKLDDIYLAPTKNQQATLSLEIPLFDWGEKKARIKAQQAVIRTRELSLEDQKNDIIIAIRQTYRDLKNQEIQIEIARQNVRNAQLTYDINLERYRNGDLTSMDLNLYQNQLSREKINLVQALINYKLTLLNMKIQSLWDFVRNQPVLEAL